MNQLQNIKAIGFTSELDVVLSKTDVWKIGILEKLFILKNPLLNLLHCKPNKAKYLHP